MGISEWFFSLCIHIPIAPDRTGYESLLFERPKFYDILRRQVPDHKISMSKKVLRSEEKDGRVIIHCADSTTYEGDILVGADGAYSGVRQSIYKQMEEKGILPKADLESFTIGYVTMVGVSEPKNPTKYSQLSENISYFSTVLGENNQSVSVSLGMSSSHPVDIT
jgi:2-polyprenyl-6-methoxyphenol hydroxylase-like FAD-dependent oxidoreductase